jgi:hypothetical protein
VVTARSAPNAGHATVSASAAAEAVSTVEILPVEHDTIANGISVWPLIGHTPPLVGAAEPRFPVLGFGSRMSPRCEWCERRKRDRSAQKNRAGEVPAREGREPKRLPSSLVVDDDRATAEDGSRGGVLVRIHLVVVHHSVCCLVPDLDPERVAVVT